MAIFSAVRAAGLWTVSAGHLADAEYVTFGDKTYTFKNTVSTTDGNVYLPTGSNDAADVAAVANLIKAINLTGVAGTDYGTNMVKSTQVKAEAGSTTRIAKISALVPGIAGTYIPFVDATAQASVDASTLGAATEGSGSAHADLSTFISNMRTYQQVNSDVERLLEQLASELA